jgi:hypothetical protein
MEFRNGNLLQLFECIESTQNEVKRKMIEAGACNAVPKSLRDECEKKIAALRAISSRSRTVVSRSPLVARKTRAVTEHCSMPVKSASQPNLFCWCERRRVPPPHNAHHDPSRTS